MWRNGELGFTLIESLVAMTILGLAVVSLMAASSGALASEWASTGHLEAVSLADAKMSEITALPLPDLAPYEETRRGSFPGALDAYTWEATVTASEESPRLWHAYVTVYGPDSSFDLETTFFRVGRIGARRSTQ